MTIKTPFLLILGMLFLASGAGIWFLMPPPEITARTKLYIAAEPPSILFPDDSRVRHEDFVSSQVDLIKDRFVLNAALRSSGIAELSMVKEQENPAQWLENEIKVETPSREVIYISLSGRDRPQDLLKLVSAVTQSYLDGVVNKDRKDRQVKLDNLKKVYQNFEVRTLEKQRTLRQLQDQNGASNEQGMAIAQQIALDHLQGVKKDLTQVRHDLRQLQVDLELHPDWVETVWPQYAAALNCLPALQLPVNHAVVALLHDDAHLLVPQAMRENRRQKQEKLRFLEAMKKTLLQEANQLAVETKQIRKQAVDFGQLKEEIEKEEKVMRMAADKINSLEIEQKAPSRITQPNKEAILLQSTPNEDNRKMIMRGAVVLAGLGMILLVFTLSRFSGNKVYYLAEHPPTPSSPD